MVASRTIQRIAHPPPGRETLPFPHPIGMVCYLLGKPPKKCYLPRLESCIVWLLKNLHKRNHPDQLRLRPHNLDAAGEGRLLNNIEPALSIMVAMLRVKAFVRPKHSQWPYNQIYSEGCLPCQKMAHHITCQRCAYR